MPLVAIAVCSYVIGLFAGYAGIGAAIASGAALVALAALALWRQTTIVAVALLVAVGAIVAGDDPVQPGAAPPPSSTGSPRPPSSTGSPRPPSGASSPRRPSATGGPANDPSTPLERWRANAGRSIDSLFGSDAPVVRALLIADTRQLPSDVRDRYARAGLVHVLAISGLHVAIIAGAVLLLLQVARLSPGTGRVVATVITALYVAAIGAPAPAVRSATMLAVVALARLLQRPVSPWATLSLGALAPLLLDPHTVTDLGYQLSVCGFASITVAGIWARRVIAPAFRGVRRRILSDFAIATVASFASAPLIAWHFLRVSLIAPVANIIAAPVIAVMQPALFLALVCAPLGAPAQLFADGARVFVRALDRVASAAAAVPGGSVDVAPTLAAAVLGGAASLSLLVAVAARRRRMRWLLAAGASFAVMAWQPLLPPPPRGMEIHLIDVGQGDAIAIRSPRGRWIVVDAGGGRSGADVGRRVVVPYLRRLGGSVAMFVMSHPHDDHVGGAAALISLLRPADVRDAAFAGTSPAYRAALISAKERGVPWHRIHPGDSANIDGITVTFLAPDSAWTARLTDPNLASAMMIVRYGAVRVLLTGDAEAAEEAWVLENARVPLRADILKVAHHGSATSTGSAFLDAVQPQLALISVGARNRYRHPSPSVVHALAARGIATLRTDQRGSIIVRTDPAGERIAVDSDDRPLGPAVKRR